MDHQYSYGGQQDPSSGSYSSYQYNDSYNQGGYTVPTSSSDYYYGGSNPQSGGSNNSNGGSTHQPPTTPTTTQGYTSQRDDNNYEGSGYSSGYNSYNNYPAQTASGNYQTGQNSSAGSSTATPYNSGGSYGGATKTGYTDRNSDYGDSSGYGGNKNPYGDSYSYKSRENGREGYPPPKEGGSYESYGSRSESGYKDNYVDDSVVQTISDTIYISNLSKDVTEEKLAEKFGGLGMLKIDRKTQKPKIWIYYDKVTGLPKGDATLTYEDPDSTAAAIKYFDNQKFLDQTIRVEMSVRKVPTSGFRGRGRSRGRGFSRGMRGSGGSGGSGGPPPRDGDWTCESCNANNFARRMECYKCHTPRSNVSGDGGHGGGRYSGAPRGGYRGRRGGPYYGRYGDDDRGYGGGSYRNSDSSHGYDQGYRRQNKQDDRQDRRENSRYLPY